jgi:hypothetical protein
MKIAPLYAKHISFAILAGCAVLSMSAQLAQNLTSSRAQVSRSKALDTVARHSLVNNCQKVVRPMLIGDVIQLHADGRSPTSCFKDPSGKIGHAAYHNSQLQVQHLFTQKELDAQISLIKAGK